MATGERLTVTYAHPPSGPLQLDLYVCVPPVDILDPAPRLDRLPFLLFLHGGHFFTGSRRDVPPWLVSLARSLGTPLLCADYRLAPHAGPAHALDDLASLWAFIQHELPWVIACCGNGAEVDTGTDALGDDFEDLQRRGGIDPARGVVVGLGAGGYLAAMGGANLSPPPLSLVLGYPTLHFEPQVPANTPLMAPPAHLADLLLASQVGNVALAQSAAPDVPMLLDRAPYAVTVLESCGMDTREAWTGLEESKRRRGLVEYLLAQGQWEAILRRASPDMTTPSAMLASQSARNRPFPPTLVFHGVDDTRTLYSDSEHLVDSIRQSEPVAAAVDALGMHGSQRGSSEAADDASPALSLRSVGPHPNGTGRYLFLGIQGPGAGHAFDALLPRTLGTGSGPPTKATLKHMGDRYKGGMIHVEHFVRHWLAEGSAVRAARDARRTPRTASTTSTSSSDGPGARIKVPRGRPRL